MGIYEVLAAPRSPWQNAYAERVIGSIRRECLDHVLVLNESGLSRLLARYLCDARAAPSSGVEPWLFALERIRLDGVDPESWSPLSGRFADLPVGLTA